MSTLSIMTWNTRLYEQGNKSINQEIDEEDFMSIVKVIQEHLQKDNSIVFAQEIPYHNNITWKKHELYKKFNIHFPDKNYDVIWNISKPNQIMMTIAIAKKGLITRDDEGLNTNRCVSIRYIPSEINILGIHADANDIQNFLGNIKKQFPSHYDFILGDFNSGNYSKNNECNEFKKNRKSYLKFTEGYIDAVQGKITTKYFTQIDHILMKKCIDKSSKYKSKVLDKIKLSDHYPLVLDIDISNNI